MQKDNPTTFRQAVTMAISFRFAMFVLIFLVCLEVVSRISPYMIPKTVHQNFLYSNRICRTECFNKGNRITWIANERGARGELYHGQDIRIAVFGSSTSADTRLDQNECWTQQLMHKLGSDKVHVDNYSRDATSHSTAGLILDHMVETGVKYDAILIMFRISDVSSTEKEAFHYWGKWAPKEGYIRFPGLLGDHLLRQAQNESRLRQIQTMIKKRIPPKPSTKKTNPDKSESKRLRQTGQARFMDEPVNFSSDYIEYIDREMQRVFSKSKIVADKVFFIAQPIAYDEDELPQVGQKWVSLYSVKDHPGYYRSNKSTAERLRKINEIMTSTAMNSGATVIDLDSHLRDFLRKRDDLYDDKWHFTPAGAELGAEFIANQIRSELGIEITGD